jgi:Eukaryotic protein of unknown function (DUF1764)
MSGAESHRSADGSAETNKPAEEAEKNKGWGNEIDDLFAGKKMKKRQQQAESEAAVAKQQKQHQAKKRKKSGQGSSHLSGKTLDEADKWVDDGLGGVYNNEGYTGRVEDGVRVFKAHLLRKPKSGGTPDCPFDCDCCFI